MKKLISSGVLVAALAAPAGAAADDRPRRTQKNAAKECKALRSRSRAPTTSSAMFGGKKNAYGKCVSQRAQAEREAARDGSEERGKECKSRARGRSGRRSRHEVQEPRQVRLRSRPSRTSRSRPRRSRSRTPPSRTPPRSARPSARSDPAGLRTSATARKRERVRQVRLAQLQRLGGPVHGQYVEQRRKLLRAFPLGGSGCGGQRGRRRRPLSVSGARWANRC